MCKIDSVVPPEQLINFASLMKVETKLTGKLFSGKLLHLIHLVKIFSSNSSQEQFLKRAFVFILYYDLSFGKIVFIIFVQKYCHFTFLIYKVT